MKTGILIMVILISAVGIFIASMRAPVTKTIVSVTVIPSVTSTVTAKVPLPQESDIIRVYFNLIDEHKISEAVMMMSDEIIKDDSQKQAWGVQLNAINSIKVQRVEPYPQSEWTNTTHIYKVILDVKMKPESANAPIPYYGWFDGENTRWVDLVKSGKNWKINGIATGP